MRYRALLVTLATAVILRRTSERTLPSISLNPSRQVSSLVSAALTHVSALLICHLKSAPRRRCCNADSVLLSCSTESPIWSTQSLRAPCSLRPLLFTSDRNSDALRTCARLTLTATCARSRGVLAAPPYDSSVRRQTSG